MPSQQCLSPKNCESAEVIHTAKASKLSLLPGKTLAAVEASTFFPPNNARGIVYKNDEFEQRLAINPRNKKNLVTTYLQDLFAITSDAPKQPSQVPGVGASYSKDGGKSWKQSLVPITKAAGGPYDRAIDPNTVIDKYGIAYCAALGANVVGPFDLVISKSLDCGKTWTLPTFIAKPSAGRDSFDYPYMTVNKKTGELLILLVNYDSTFGVGDELYLYRSNDKGVTWSANLIQSTPTSDSFFAIYALEILPSGKLVTAFYTPNFITNALSAYSITSSDDGYTWTNPVLFDNIPDTTNQLTPFDLGNGIPFRNLELHLAIASHPKKDWVYLTYMRRGLSASDRSVAVLISKDAGASWTGPILGNRVAPETQAWCPVVAVNKKGIVAISFYDFRFYVQGSDVLATDRWISFFNEDLSQYLGETRVTCKSFDSRQLVIIAPNSISPTSYFVGDYMGMLADGKEFLLTFVKTNNLGLPIVLPGDQTTVIFDQANRQDIQFARVKFICPNECVVENIPFLYKQPVETSRDVSINSKSRKRHN